MTVVPNFAQMCLLLNLKACYWKFFPQTKYHFCLNSSTTGFKGCFGSPKGAVADFNKFRTQKCIVGQGHWERFHHYLISNYHITYFNNHCWQKNVDVVSKTINTFTETPICKTHRKNSLAYVGSLAACAALPSTVAGTYPVPHDYNRFCFRYFKITLTY